MCNLIFSIIYIALNIVADRSCCYVVILHQSLRVVIYIKQIFNSCLKNYITLWMHQSYTNKYGKILGSSNEWKSTIVVQVEPQFAKANFPRRCTEPHWLLDYNHMLIYYHYYHRCLLSPFGTTKVARRPIPPTKSAPLKGHMRPNLFKVSWQ